jgi:hypothetical protein
MSAYVGRIAEKSLGGTPPNLFESAAVAVALVVTATAASLIPALERYVSPQDALRQD